MSDDDADVNAELLALAGDDSDDDSDDGQVNGTAAHNPRSPDEEAKPSVEKVEEPVSRRGVAQKVRKNRKKRDRRQEIEDELDDLDDGSPSPQPEPVSDAMSDYSGDAARPVEPIDAGPQYPIEGRFESVADRDHILSLPEIERETILAERAAVETKRQQDLQLRKALAESNAAASKQKRKAAAAELEDGGARKSSRPKTEKPGRTALDDYKKAREAKGAERSGRVDSRRDGGRSPSSSASDRNAGGESEVEWAEPTSISRRDEPAADLKDFERCRIGRTNFAKICFYPNFETTMRGCYCRISIGMNRESGQNMYRMAQIKDIAPGKPYNLELPSGKTFTTDQYALVAHGTAEKLWPFSACSDSRIFESEFQRYKETLEKERLRFPKRAHLEQKLDDLHKFLNVSWTEETLQGKFSRQKEMAKRVDPTNITTMKRQAILRRKASAEEAADAEEVSRCEAELAALENNSLNSTTALKPRPTQFKTNSQQEKLALLNLQNRNKNAEDVRKALLADRAKLHAERERAKAKAAAAKLEKERQALLGVPGNEMADLFGSDVSRAGTPTSGVSTPKIRRSRAGTPVNGVKKGPSGLGRKRGVEEDEDLDLGIEIEI